MGKYSFRLVYRTRGLRPLMAWSDYNYKHVKSLGSIYHWRIHHFNKLFVISSQKIVFCIAQKNRFLYFRDVEMSILQSNFVLNSRKLNSECSCVLFSSSECHSYRDIYPTQQKVMCIMAL